MRMTLRDIFKSFGDVEVVKGLNLELDDGEFVVLLGPSGCGKTTALRMVAGLETATAGQIFIGDREVTKVLPKHRDVAMVFQSYALYPHMTVSENIGYPLKLRRVAKEERDGRIREAAGKVHLEEYLDRYPRALSGGQRQRVALARAIVRRPSLFLLDEPLSNLDAKLRGYMRAELKRLQGDLGVTTLYVTHDQIEAMTLAHRVAVMNKGVVQQIASPREIYDDPANLFVAGFIGSPPMNTIRGTAADGYFVVPEGRVAIGDHAAGKALILGFRPEDARVVEPEGADLMATIFACELTGNETIVTCTVGTDQVIVKMDKDFDMAVDTPIGIRIDTRKLSLFDPESGNRVARPAAAAA